MYVIIVMNISHVMCCSQTHGHMSNAWSHVKRMVTCQTHGHVTAVNGKPWLTMRAISQHLINEFLSNDV